MLANGEAIAPRGAPLVAVLAQPPKDGSGAEMVVAGLRFDTSAIHLAGSRWTHQPRSAAGFTVRHLPGV